MRLRHCWGLGLLSAAILVACGTQDDLLVKRSNKSLLFSFSADLSGEGDPSKEPDLLPDEPVDPTPGPNPEPTLLPDEPVDPTPGPNPKPTLPPEEPVEPTPEPMPLPEPTLLPEDPVDPTPVPSMPPEDDGDDSGSEDPIDEVDHAELGKCSKYLGINARRIHVASRGNERIISTNEALAVKVTGTHNSVQIILTGEDQNEVPGVCVFAAGNIAQVKIDNQLVLKKLVVIGRGNQALIEINTQAGASIDDSVIDLAGNKTKVVFKGAGDYECPGANYKKRGNSQGAVCE